jgi:hypothetical protein
MNPNPYFANIYGGVDMDKVASAEEQEQLPGTLEELALQLALGTVDDPEDQEKVASVQAEAFEDLVHHDLLGRAYVQAEISRMEKQAAEGDADDLQSFFADIVEYVVEDEE